MSEKFDKQYLRMAQIWSENSYAKRLKVGAIIVKDQMIISDGFNGTPRGFANVCEDDNGNTHPYVLHAEANAITKVAQSTNSSKDMKSETFKCLVYKQIAPKGVILQTTTYPFNEIIFHF